MRVLFARLWTREVNLQRDGGPAERRVVSVNAWSSFVKDCGASLPGLLFGRSCGLEKWRPSALQSNEMSEGP